MIRRTSVALWEGDGIFLQPRRPSSFTPTHYRAHIGAAYSHTEMLLANRDGHV